LVIYGILAPERTAQIVRVLATHPPAEFIVAPESIPGSTVSVSDGMTSYSFADSAVAALGPQGDSIQIPVYVGRFSPTPGTTYTLTVNAPGFGPASSELVVPDSAEFFVLPFRFRDPYSFDLDEFISVSMNLSAFTKGFRVRLFLEYEISVGAGWERRVLEIPLSLTNFNNRWADGAAYPTVIRKESSMESVLFSNRVYRHMLGVIWEGVPKDLLKMRRAIIVVQQIEESLYNYFNTANGFSDEFSIRLDKPDYSNINGGVGLFSATTTDSFFVSLPDTLGPPGRL
jgi:hypothetical protein